MHCKHVQEQLWEYLEGGLAPVERADLDAHLGACGDCQRELLEARGTLTALNRMPTVQPPTDAWWAVMLRVQRQRADALARRPAPPSWATWWAQLNPFRVAGLAAAGTALILGAVFVAPEPSVWQGPLRGIVEAIAPQPAEPKVVPAPRLRIGFGDVDAGVIPIHVTVLPNTVLADTEIVARRRGGPWAPSHRGTISPQSPAALGFKLDYAPGKVEALQLSVKSPGAGQWDFLIVTPLGPPEAQRVSLNLTDRSLEDCLVSIVHQVGRPVVVDGRLDDLVTLQVRDEAADTALQALAAQTGRQLLEGPTYQLVRMQ